MTWWQITLAAFGYLFVAGWVETAYRDKEPNWESIFMGVFWPFVAGILIVWGIVFAPVWLGSETFKLPQRKRTREYEKKIAEQRSRMERDKKIRELEEGLENEQTNI